MGKESEPLLELAYKRYLKEPEGDEILSCYYRSYLKHRDSTIEENKITNVQSLYYTDLNVFIYYLE